MANRPLPNVDPEALSKLASQYPGSGSGRTEPKLGGPGGGSGSGGAGSGGGTGSGDGGSGNGDDKPGAPAAGEPASKAADKAPAQAETPKPAGSSGPAAGERPVASVEPTPAKPASGSGGSRTAAVLTFLFALVALAAALGALAAPSLRSEARTLLQRYASDWVSPKTIDFITGQDTGRLEVTYAGLDQRVERLTSALDRIVGAPGIDPAAARELLLRTEQNQRLSAVETKLSGLDGVRQSLDAVASRTEAVEKSLTDLRASVEGLGPRIGEAAAGVQANATATTDLSKRLDDSVTAAAEKVAGLTAEVGKLQADLAPMLSRTDKMAAQRAAIELPLIGLTQLRLALNRDTPFVSELSLAELLVGEDSEALGALSDLKANAPTGVTTLPGLRRDFTFVATQMGGSLTRIQSWTQRLSSWLEVMVGTRTMPEADPIGEITAAVASIDAALEAGQLDLALQEAVALNGRRSDVLLEGWVVEARRRLTTERAFNALSERIYARIGATR